MHPIKKETTHSFKTKNINTGLFTGEFLVYCGHTRVRSAKSSSTHQKSAFFLCFCLAEWKFLCLSFKTLLRIELKSSFLVVEEYILEKFWDKESTKRMKMLKMTCRLFKFNIWMFIVILFSIRVNFFECLLWPCLHMIRAFRC